MYYGTLANRVRFFTASVNEPGIQKQIPGLIYPILCNWKYVVMPHIYQDNHFVSFVIPDDTDVHVDAALKKVRGTFDAFGEQQRVERIFGQEY
ncbi:MAG: hypothetical protein K1W25_13615 [Lachnospiraceae bacterium]